MHKINLLNEIENMIVTQTVTPRSKWYLNTDIHVLMTYAHCIFVICFISEYKEFIPFRYPAPIEEEASKKKKKGKTKQEE